MLNSIKKHENLRIAANLSGYSYRKAWNMLNHCEDLLGMTLVDKKPGKGTQLTTLGKTLIDTETENKRNLTETSFPEKLNLFNLKNEVVKKQKHY